MPEYRTSSERPVTNIGFVHQAVDSADFPQNPTIFICFENRMYNSRWKRASNRLEVLGWNHTQWVIRVVLEPEEGASRQDGQVRDLGVSSRRWELSGNSDFDRPSGDFIGLVLKIGSQRA